jgi:hypothetical protein
MSWIDDAKQKAQEQKAKELHAEQEKFDRDLESFHLHTSKTKQEIERVLDEACRQGLTVEGPNEEYLYGNKSTPGFLSRKIPFDIRRGHRDDSFDWWAYVWKISLPQKEIDGVQKSNFRHTLDIYLSLYKADGEPVPVLTTSAKRVEKEIKDWLYDIYKDEY